MSFESPNIFHGLADFFLTLPFEKKKARHIGLYIALFTRVYHAISITTCVMYTVSYAYNLAPTYSTTELCGVLFIEARVLIF